MIRYDLTGSELTAVQFAVSPLNELCLSLRAWRYPGLFPLHLPWLRELEAARPGLDEPVLLALTNARAWIPDFLNPCPRSPLTRIDDELAALSRSDRAEVRRDLRSVHGGALPPPLRGPALPRIVEALTAYWHRCFAPHWPRMRALLEGDVVFRGRQIAQHGLAAMFAALPGTVRLADRCVEVHLQRHPDVAYTRPTPDGLTLVPSLWTPTASVPLSPLQKPMILYGARGIGALWHPQELASPAALTDLLGATRAGLLMTLSTPASATELATRLGVTPSAVTQHLRVLHATGLLVRTRHGRSVLYHRSDLGDHLTAAG